MPLSRPPKTLEKSFMETDMRKLLLIMLALLIAMPGFAGDRKKKPNRVMIEKMEAVPCGAKERGLTGLGSVWASVGITSVNSDEKLCPQYLLRSDDMEYHVRPLDKKHPVLLPVGLEGEFKIKKDKFDMRVPEGGSDHKTRQYQVVSMKPIDHTENASYRGSSYDAPPAGSTKLPTDRNYATGTNATGVATPPANPNNYPQQ
jgi:hypothetical protein